MTTNWQQLIEDIENAQKEGMQSTIKSKATLDRMVETHDRLIDEIKSGEYIPEQWLEPIAKTFNKFLSIQRGVDYWSFKQACLFALNHIYLHCEKNNMVNTLIEKMLENQQLFGLIVRCVAEPKREIRDAASQNLGHLAKHIGTMIESKLYVLKNLKALLTEYPGQTTHEGYVTALSYVYANKGWEKDEATFVQQELLNQTENKDFSSYSWYIRLESIKGLARIVAKKQTMPEDDLKKVIVERMKDDNIDVRRANGVLCSNYLITLGNQELVQSMLQQLATLTNKTWEYRHGAACCYEAIVSKGHVIMKMPIDQLNAGIVQPLVHIIQSTPSEKDTNSAGANAKAGRALTELVCTIIQLEQQRCAGPLFAKVTNFENHSLAQHVFKESLIPMLNYMFQSGFAQILDAAAVCLDVLMKKASSFVKPYMNGLMCGLFGNKFHAAYPIRSSATTIWNRAYEHIYKETHPEMDDLITTLTQPLLHNLKNVLTHKNFEIRETGFFGIADVMKQTSFTDFSQEVFVDLFNMIVRGVRDASGGSFAVVCRFSALCALAAFIQYYSNYGESIPADIEMTLISETVNVLKETIVLIDFPDMIKGSAMVLEALVAFESFHELKHDLVAHVLMLTKLQYNVDLSYPMLPLLVHVLCGDFNEYATREKPSFLTSIATPTIEMILFSQEEIDEEFAIQYSMIWRDAVQLESLAGIDIVDIDATVASLARVIIANEIPLAAQVNGLLFFIKLLRENVLFTDHVFKKFPQLCKFLCFHLATTLANGSSSTTPNLNELLNNTASVSYKVPDLSSIEPNFFHAGLLETLGRFSSLVSTAYAMDQDLPVLVSALKSISLEIDEDEYPAADGFSFDDWEDDNLFCLFTPTSPYQIGANINKSPYSSTNAFVENALKRASEVGFVYLKDIMFKSLLNDDQDSSTLCQLWIGTFYVLFHHGVTFLQHDEEDTQAIISDFVHTHLLPQLTKVDKDDQDESLIWKWRVLEAIFRASLLPETQGLTLVQKLFDLYGSKTKLAAYSDFEQVLVATSLTMGFGVISYVADTNDLMPDSDEESEEENEPPALLADFLQFLADFISNSDIMEGKLNVLHLLDQLGVDYMLPPPSKFSVKDNELCPRH